MEYYGLRGTDLHDGTCWSYGPWNIVYRHFVQWQGEGLFERIFAELGERVR